MRNERTPLPVRFWRHVVKTGGCWLWTAGTTRQGGYGQIRVGGKRGPYVLAHRLSYEMHIGPIAAPSLRVCHRCDNPKCVRPDHLFIGTQADNVRDMVAKGRSRGAVGVRNAKARLTEADVRTIRNRYEKGGVSQQKLGDEYGVSQFAISAIVRRQNWSHVA